MSNLLEKTCELIMTEGQFAMFDYSPMPSMNGVHALEGSPRRDLCCTACCIAGNILLASGMTPEELSKMPLSSISPKARETWAREYGWESAYRLQFTEQGWGDGLEDVLPEEACAHLRGADPVWHGLPPTSYDDIRSTESDY